MTAVALFFVALTVAVWVSAAQNPLVDPPLTIMPTVAGSAMEQNGHIADGQVYHDASDERKKQEYIDLFCADYYRVSDVTEVTGGKKYVLTSDLTLSGTDQFFKDTTFDAETVFDGAGHTITIPVEISIGRTAFGLLATQMSGGTIKNLTVKYVGGAGSGGITRIHSTAGGNIHLGGLVGNLSGGTIENCKVVIDQKTVEFGRATGNYGDSWFLVGGFAGYATNGTIVKSTFEVTASSVYALWDNAGGDFWNRPTHTMHLGGMIGRSEPASGQAVNLVGVTTQGGGAYSVTCSDNWGTQYSAIGMFVGSCSGSQAAQINGYYIKDFSEKRYSSHLDSKTGGLLVGDGGSLGIGVVSGYTAPDVESGWWMSGTNSGNFWRRLIVDKTSSDGCGIQAMGFASSTDANGFYVAAEASRIWVDFTSGYQKGASVGKKYIRSFSYADQSGAAEAEVYSAVGLAADGSVTLPVSGYPGYSSGSTDGVLNFKAQSYGEYAKAVPYIYADPDARTAGDRYANLVLSSDSPYRFGKVFDGGVISADAALGADAIYCYRTVDGGGVEDARVYRPLNVDTVLYAAIASVWTQADTPRSRYDYFWNVQADYAENNEFTGADGTLDYASQVRNAGVYRYTFGNHVNADGLLTDDNGSVLFGYSVGTENAAAGDFLYVVEQSEFEVNVAKRELAVTQTQSASAQYDGTFLDPSVSVDRNLSAAPDRAATYFDYFYANDASASFDQAIGCDQFGEADHTAAQERTFSVSGSPDLETAQLYTDAGVYYTQLRLGSDLNTVSNYVVGADSVNRYEITRKAVSFRADADYYAEYSGAVYSLLPIEGSGFVGGSIVCEDVWGTLADGALYAYGVIGSARVFRVTYTKSGSWLNAGTYEARAEVLTKGGQVWKENDAAYGIMNYTLAQAIEDNRYASVGSVEQAYYATYRYEVQKYAPRLTFYDTAELYDAVLDRIDRAPQDKNKESYHTIDFIYAAQDGWTARDYLNDLLRSYGFYTASDGVTQGRWGNAFELEEGYNPSSIALFDGLTLADLTVALDPAGYAPSAAIGSGAIAYDLSVHHNKNSGDPDNISDRMAIDTAASLDGQDGHETLACVNLRIVVADVAETADLQQTVTTRFYRSNTEGEATGIYPTVCVPADGMQYATSLARQSAKSVLPRYKTVDGGASVPVVNVVQGTLSTDGGATVSGVGRMVWQKEGGADRMALYSDFVGVNYGTIRNVRFYLGVSRPAMTLPADADGLIYGAVAALNEGTIDRVSSAYRKDLGQNEGMWADDNAVGASIAAAGYIAGFNRGAITDCSVHAGIMSGYEDADTSAEGWWRLHYQSAADVAVFGGIVGINDGGYLNGVSTVNSNRQQLVGNYRTGYVGGIAGALSNDGKVTIAGHTLAAPARVFGENLPAIRNAFVNSADLAATDTNGNRKTAYLGVFAGIATTSGAADVADNPQMQGLLYAIGEKTTANGSGDADTGKVFSTGLADRPSALGYCADQTSADVFVGAKIGLSDAQGGGLTMTSAKDRYRAQERSLTDGSLTLTLDTAQLPSQQNVRFAGIDLTNGERLRSYVAGDPNDDSFLTGIGNAAAQSYTIAHLYDSSDSYGAGRLWANPDRCAALSQDVPIIGLVYGCDYTAKSAEEVRTVLPYYLAARTVKAVDYGAILNFTVDSSLGGSIDLGTLDYTAGIKLRRGCVFDGGSIDLQYGINTLLWRNHNTPDDAVGMKASDPSVAAGTSKGAFAGALFGIAEGEIANVRLTLTRMSAQAPADSGAQVYALGALCGYTSGAVRNCDVVWQDGGEIVFSDGALGASGGAVGLAYGAAIDHTRVRFGGTSLSVRAQSSVGIGASGGLIGYSLRSQIADCGIEIDAQSGLILQTALFATKASGGAVGLLNGGELLRTIVESDGSMAAVGGGNVYLGGAVGACDVTDVVDGTPRLTVGNADSFVVIEKSLITDLYVRMSDAKFGAVLKDADRSAAGTIDLNGLNPLARVGWFTGSAAWDWSSNPSLTGMYYEIDAYGVPLLANASAQTASDPTNAAVSIGGERTTLRSLFGYARVFASQNARAITQMRVQIRDRALAFYEYLPIDRSFTWTADGALQIVYTGYAPADDVAWSAAYVSNGSSAGDLPYGCAAQGTELTVRAASGFVDASFEEGGTETLTQWGSGADALTLAADYSVRIENRAQLLAFLSGTYADIVGASRIAAGASAAYLTSDIVMAEGFARESILLPGKTLYGNHRTITIGTDAPRQRTGTGFDSALALRYRLGYGIALSAFESKVYGGLLDVNAGTLNDLNVTITGDVGGAFAEDRVILGGLVGINGGALKGITLTLAADLTLSPADGSLGYFTLGGIVGVNNGGSLDQITLCGGNVSMTDGALRVDEHTNRVIGNYGSAAFARCGGIAGVMQLQHKNAPEGQNAKTTRINDRYYFVGQTPTFNDIYNGFQGRYETAAGGTYGMIAGVSAFSDGAELADGQPLYQTTLPVHVAYWQNLNDRNDTEEVFSQYALAGESVSVWGVPSGDAAGETVTFGGAGIGVYLPEFSRALTGMRFSTRWGADGSLVFTLEDQPNVRESGVTAQFYARAGASAASVTIREAIENFSQADQRLSAFTLGSGFSAAGGLYTLDWRYGVNVASQEQLFDYLCGTDSADYAYRYALRGVVTGNIEMTQNRLTYTVDGVAKALRLEQNRTLEGLKGEYSIRKQSQSDVGDSSLTQITEYPTVVYTAAQSAAVDYGVRYGAENAESGANSDFYGYVLAYAVMGVNNGALSNLNFSFQTAPLGRFVTGNANALIGGICAVNNGTISGITVYLPQGGEEGTTLYNQDAANADRVNAAGWVVGLNTGYMDGVRFFGYKARYSAAFRTSAASAAYGALVGVNHGGYLQNVEAVSRTALELIAPNETAECYIGGVMGVGSNDGKVTFGVRDGTDAPIVLAAAERNAVLRNAFVMIRHGLGVTRQINGMSVTLDDGSVDPAYTKNRLEYRRSGYRGYFAGQITTSARTGAGNPTIDGNVFVEYGTLSGLSYLSRAQGVSVFADQTALVSGAEEIALAQSQQLSVLGHLPSDRIDELIAAQGNECVFTGGMPDVRDMAGVSIFQEGYGKTSRFIEEWESDRVANFSITELIRAFTAGDSATVAKMLGYGTSQNFVDSAIDPKEAYGADGVRFDRDQTLFSALSRARVTVSDDLGVTANTAAAFTYVCQWRLEMRDDKALQAFIAGSEDYEYLFTDAQGRLDNTYRVAAGAHSFVLLDKGSEYHITLSLTDRRVLSDGRALIYENASAETVAVNVNVIAPKEGRVNVTERSAGAVVTEKNKDPFVHPTQKLYGVGGVYAMIDGGVLGGIDFCLQSNDGSQTPLKVDNRDENAVVYTDGKPTEEREVAEYHVAAGGVIGLVMSDLGSGKVKNLTADGTPFENEFTDMLAGAHLNRFRLQIDPHGSSSTVALGGVYGYVKTEATVSGYTGFSYSEGLESGNEKRTVRTNVVLTDTSLTIGSIVRNGGITEVTGTTSLAALGGMIGINSGTVTGIVAGRSDYGEIEIRENNFFTIATGFQRMASLGGVIGINLGGTFTHFNVHGELTDDENLSSGTNSVFRLMSAPAGDTVSSGVASMMGGVIGVSTNGELSNIAFTGSFDLYHGIDSENAAYRHDTQYAFTGGFLGLGSNVESNAANGYMNPYNAGTPYYVNFCNKAVSLLSYCLISRTMMHDIFIGYYGKIAVPDHTYFGLIAARFVNGKNSVNCRNIVWTHENVSKVTDIFNIITTDGSTGWEGTSFEPSEMITLEYAAVLGFVPESLINNKLNVDGVNSNIAGKNQPVISGARFWITDFTNEEDRRVAFQARMDTIDGKATLLLQLRGLVNADGSVTHLKQAGVDSWSTVLLQSDRATLLHGADGSELDKTFEQSGYYQADIGAIQRIFAMEDFDQAILEGHNNKQIHPYFRFTVYMSQVKIQTEDQLKAFISGYDWGDSSLTRYANAYVGIVEKNISYTPDMYYYDTTLTYAFTLNKQLIGEGITITIEQPVYQGKEIDRGSTYYFSGNSWNDVVTKYGFTTDSLVGNYQFAYHRGLFVNAIGEQGSISNIDFVYNGNVNLCSKDSAFSSGDAAGITVGVISALCAGKMENVSLTMGAESALTAYKKTFRYSDAWEKEKNYAAVGGFTGMLAGNGKELHKDEDTGYISTGKPGKNKTAQLVNCTLTMEENAQSGAQLRAIAVGYAYFSTDFANSDKQFGQAGAYAGGMVGWMGDQSKIVNATVNGGGLIDAAVTWVGRIISSRYSGGVGGALNYQCVASAGVVVGCNQMSDTLASSINLYATSSTPRRGVVPYMGMIDGVIHNWYGICRESRSESKKFSGMTGGLAVTGARETNNWLYSYNQSYRQMIGSGDMTGSNDDPSRGIKNVYVVNRPLSADSIGTAKVSYDPIRLSQFESDAGSSTLDTDSQQVLRINAGSQYPYRLVGLGSAADNALEVKSIHLFEIGDGTSNSDSQRTDADALAEKEMAGSVRLTWDKTVTEPQNAGIVFSLDLSVLDKSMFLWDLQAYQSKQSRLKGVSVDSPTSMTKKDVDYPDGWHQSADGTEYGSYDPEKDGSPAAFFDPVFKKIDSLRAALNHNVYQSRAMTRGSEWYVYYSTGVVGTITIDKDKYFYEGESGAYYNKDPIKYGAGEFNLPSFAFYTYTGKKLPVKDAEKLYSGIEVTMFRGRYLGPDAVGDYEPIEYYYYGTPNPEHPSAKPLTYYAGALSPQEGDFSPGSYSINLRDTMGMSGMIADVTTHFIVFKDSTTTENFTLIEVYEPKNIKEKDLTIVKEYDGLASTRGSVLCIDTEGWSDLEIQNINALIGGMGITNGRFKQSDAGVGIDITFTAAGWQYWRYDSATNSVIETTVAMVPNQDGTSSGYGILLDTPGLLKGRGIIVPRTITLESVSKIYGESDAKSRFEYSGRVLDGIDLSPALLSALKGYASDNATAQTGAVFSVTEYSVTYGSICSDLSSSGKIEKIYALSGGALGGGNYGFDQRTGAYSSSSGTFTFAGAGAIYPRAVTSAAVEKEYDGVASVSKDTVGIFEFQSENVSSSTGVLKKDKGDFKPIGAYNSKNVAEANAIVWQTYGAKYTVSGKNQTYEVFGSKLGENVIGNYYLAHDAAQNYRITPKALNGVTVQSYRQNRPDETVTADESVEYRVAYSPAATYSVMQYAVDGLALESDAVGLKFEFKTVGGGSVDPTDLALPLDAGTYEAYPKMSDDPAFEIANANYTIAEGMKAVNTLTVTQRYVQKSQITLIYQHCAAQYTGDEQGLSFDSAKYRITVTVDGITLSDGGTTSKDSVSLGNGQVNLTIGGADTQKEIGTYEIAFSLNAITAQNYALDPAAAYRDLPAYRTSGGERSTFSVYPRSITVESAVKSYDGTDLCTSQTSVGFGGGLTSDFVPYGSFDSKNAGLRTYTMPHSGEFTYTVSDAGQDTTITCYRLYSDAAKLSPEYAVASVAELTVDNAAILPNLLSEMRFQKMYDGTNAIVYDKKSGSSRGKNITELTVAGDLAGAESAADVPVQATYADRNAGVQSVIARIQTFEFNAANYYLLVSVDGGTLNYYANGRIADQTLELENAGMILKYDFSGGELAQITDVKVGNTVIGGGTAGTVDYKKDVSYSIADITAKMQIGEELHAFVLEGGYLTIPGFASGEKLRFSVQFLRASARDTIAHNAGTYTLAFQLEDVIGGNAENYTNDSQEIDGKFLIKKKAVFEVYVVIPNLYKTYGGRKLFTLQDITEAIKTAYIVEDDGEWIAAKGFQNHYVTEVSEAVLNAVNAGEYALEVTIAQLGASDNYELTAPVTMDAITAKNGSKSKCVIEQSTLTLTADTINSKTFDGTTYYLLDGVNGERVMIGDLNADGYEWAKVGDHGSVGFNFSVLHVVKGEDGRDQETMCRNYMVKAPSSISLHVLPSGGLMAERSVVGGSSKITVTLGGLRGVQFLGMKHAELLAAMEVGADHVLTADAQSRYEAMLFAAVNDFEATPAWKLLNSLGDISVTIRQTEDAEGFLTYALVGIFTPDPSVLSGDFAVDTATLSDRWSFCLDKGNNGKSYANTASTDSALAAGQYASDIQSAAGIAISDAKGLRDWMSKGGDAYLTADIYNFDNTGKSVSVNGKLNGNGHIVQLTGAVNGDSSAAMPIGQKATGGFFAQTLSGSISNVNFVFSGNKQTSATHYIGVVFGRITATGSLKNVSLTLQSGISATAEEIGGFAHSVKGTIEHAEVIFTSEFLQNKASYGFGGIAYDASEAKSMTKIVVRTHARKMILPTGFYTVANRSIGVNGLIDSFFRDSNAPRFASQVEGAVNTNVYDTQLSPVSGDERTVFAEYYFGGTDRTGDHAYRTEGGESQRNTSYYCVYSDAGTDAVSVEVIAPLGNFVWEAYGYWYRNPVDGNETSLYGTSVNRVVAVFPFGATLTADGYRWNDQTYSLGYHTTTSADEQVTSFTPAIGVRGTRMISVSAAASVAAIYDGTKQSVSVKIVVEENGVSSEQTINIAGTDVGYYNEAVRIGSGSAHISGDVAYEETMLCAYETNRGEILQNGVELYIYPSAVQFADGRIDKTYDASAIAEQAVTGTLNGEEVRAAGRYGTPNTQGAFLPSSDAGTYDVRWLIGRTVVTDAAGNFLTKETVWDGNSLQSLWKIIRIDGRDWNAADAIGGYTTEQFVPAYMRLADYDPADESLHDTDGRLDTTRFGVQSVVRIATVGMRIVTDAKGNQAADFSEAALYYGARLVRTSQGVCSDARNYALAVGDRLETQSLTLLASDEGCVTAREPTAGTIRPLAFEGAYDRADAAGLNQSYRDELRQPSIKDVSVATGEGISVLQRTLWTMDDTQWAALQDRVALFTKTPKCDVLGALIEQEGNNASIVRQAGKYYAAHQTYAEIRLPSEFNDLTGNFAVSVPSGSADTLLSMRWFRYGKDAFGNEGYRIETFEDFVRIGDAEGDYQTLTYLLERDLNGKSRVLKPFDWAVRTQDGVSATQSFGGRIIGNGYTVSNFILRGEREVALFVSMTPDARVENLILANVVLDAQTDGSEADRTEAAFLTLRSNGAAIEKVSAEGRLVVNRGAEYTTGNGIDASASPDAVSTGQAGIVSANAEDEITPAFMRVTGQEASGTSFLLGGNLLYSHSFLPDEMRIANAKTALRSMMDGCVLYRTSTLRNVFTYEPSTLQIGLLNDNFRTRYAYFVIAPWLAIPA